MEDVMAKYDLLDPSTQKEVKDFIDFLLEKRGKEKHGKKENSYQEKIQAVSTWSKENLNVFNVNRKLFNQWKISEW